MKDLDQVDVEAAKAGDHEAYRRLVERHEAEISGLMWRFSSDRAVCEELVQEVFVEAYLSLATYRAEAPLVFWLKRIGSRVGYRYWKQQARRRHLVPLDQTDLIEAPSPGPDPEAVRQVVQRLLGRLAPVDRLVLVLMYFDDCSTEEIARRMGWNRAMVKMRAYRARRRLLTIIQNEHILEDLEWLR